MGRYGRTVIGIAVVVVLAGLILGFQKIAIGNFERGGDTPLGLSLGLDLQGGSHLVYQAALKDPDTGEPVQVTPDQMDSLRRTIERRVNGSGLGEPIIQLLGEDRLLIQLPGVSDTERAKNILGETARLEFKRREFNVTRDVTEVTQADVLSVTADFVPVPSPTPEPDAAGTPTPEPVAEDPPLALMIEFTPQGAEAFSAITDRMTESLLLADLALRSGNIGAASPGALDITVVGAETINLRQTALSLGRVAETDTYFFVLPPDADTGQPPSQETALTRLGADPQVSFIEIQGSVDEDTGLTGDNLARAFPGQHAQSGIPIVNLEFDNEGTRMFGELTLDIVRKEEETGESDQIAIFLDDAELISPSVEAAITAGTAIIQGRDFTIERVRDLSLLLEAGRLPVPIELIQERNVDAILGADSLAKSVVAGFVGLGLVLAFMTLYYRLPGLVASVALVIYATLVLAIFKVLPVTLTLSGVAALVLSVGMAVDANILIFERMKDELRAGRTLLSSINIGFDRAWPAIRDGNISTLITCGILFWFADQLGASIVQGFAVSLAIGVVVSMFTAIIISRTMLRFVATTALSRTMRVWLPSGGSEVPQQASG